MKRLFAILMAVVVAALPVIGLLASPIPAAATPVTGNPRALLVDSTFCITNPNEDSGESECSAQSAGGGQYAGASTYFEYLGSHGVYAHVSVDCPYVWEGVYYSYESQSDAGFYLYASAKVMANGTTLASVYVTANNGGSIVSGGNPYYNTVALQALQCSFPDVQYGSW